MTFSNEPKENCINHITACALLAITSTFWTFNVIDTVRWIDGNTCVRITLCWELWACNEMLPPWCPLTALLLPSRQMFVPFAYLCTVLWCMFVSDENKNKNNPGGGEIFRTRPDRPWGPPILLYSGYRVFLGGKEARAWCWPPIPFLAPRSRVSRGIPLLQRYTSTPPQGP
jgi:hypothetical protein